MGVNLPPPLYDHSIIHNIYPWPVPDLVFFNTTNSVSMSDMQPCLKEGALMLLLSRRCCHEWRRCCPERCRCCHERRRYCHEGTRKIILFILKFPPQRPPETVIYRCQKPNFTIVTAASLDIEKTVTSSGMTSFLRTQKKWSRVTFFVFAQKCVTQCKNHNALEKIPAQWMN